MTADGDQPLYAFVEIPKGSRNKYEFDPRLGQVVLDRTLWTSVVYPADYGFLIDTLGRDGDPVDAVVLVAEPTFPGCVIPVEPIGGVGSGADRRVRDARREGRGRQGALRAVQGPEVEPHARHH